MNDMISTGNGTSSPLLSAVDLAHRLHVSVATVYLWTRRGILPSPRRLGRSSRWLWTDVEMALANLPGAQRKPATRELTGSHSDAAQPR